MISICLYMSAWVIEFTACSIVWAPAAAGKAAQTRANTTRFMLHISEIVGRDSRYTERNWERGEPSDLVWPNDSSRS